MIEDFKTVAPDKASEDELKRLQEPVAFLVDKQGRICMVEPAPKKNRLMVEQPATKR